MCLLSLRTKLSRWRDVVPGYDWPSNVITSSPSTAIGRRSVPGIRPSPCPGVLDYVLTFYPIFFFSFSFLYETVESYWNVTSHSFFSFYPSELGLQGPILVTFPHQALPDLSGRPQVDFDGRPSLSTPDVSSTTITLSRRRFLNC